MVNLNKQKNDDRINGWLNDLTTRYPVLLCARESLEKAFVMLKETFYHGYKLLICGNGGSATDAEHLSGELGKGFLKKRPLAEEFLDRLHDNATLMAGTDPGWVKKLQGALPVIPLTGNHALMTAIANDLGEELIFAQQLLGLGSAGDTLLAISTSGNANNVVKAVLVARSLGMHTLGLTGESGGRLRELCDLTIQVPAVDTYQVQELHLPVYHTLAAMLEEEFFG